MHRIGSGQMEFEIVSRSLSQDSDIHGSEREVIATLINAIELDKMRLPRLIKNVSKNLRSEGGSIQCSATRLRAE
jgi:hypothetical protein